MKPIEVLSQLQAWQVLKRELLIDCPPWLSLWREAVRLPDGREISDYHQIDQRDYVEIAAWQNGRVFGLWGYKHGPRRVTLGLPAGYLEDGECPLDAARRELKEEAALASDNWQVLGSYCVDGNRSQARAHICLAHDCRSVEAGPSDDLEVKSGQWLTPKEWGEHLATGTVATLGAAMAVHAGILAIAR